MSDPFERLRLVSHDDGPGARRTESGDDDERGAPRIENADDTLDPLRVALSGSHLIEASAGTGKTWTIAGLYLRLVLGHGDDRTRFAHPLLPRQILVMTFTVNATRELSDRIRGRLVEAARCFRGEQAPAIDDPFLQSLLDDHPPGSVRDAAAWRLAMAAEAMDDAAVLTIDGWCQRMLREHAADSASLVDETVLTEALAYVDDAARDYWRRNVYPLHGEALDAVLAEWASVDALIADVKALLPEVAGPMEVDGSLGELLNRLHAAWDAELERWRAGARTRASDVREWFTSRLAVTPAVFNGTKVRAGYVDVWCNALDVWAGTRARALPELSESAWKRLSPEGLHDAHKGRTPLEPPAWSQELVDLRGSLGSVPVVGDAMRRHALASVREQAAAMRREARTPGFLDMLERLDAALHGANGERLRAQIVEQFPVALIDEFQDTSPLQYRIFDRVYRTASNDPSTALFLIGDPKQSIFAFRGADIRSYLRARVATEGRRHRLGTNHRSTVAVVDAVNRLFVNAESRAGAGAFMFRGLETIGDHGPLPFTAVGARGRAERFRTSAGTVPALTFCHDPEVLTRKEIWHRFAERAAEHIVSLLNDREAGFDDPTDGFTRLRQADIAVLVRDRNEAEAVRTALRRRGVASVYLSDRNFVFANPLAKDLVRWLEAVASPLDHARVRATLATAMIGLSIPELAVLASDDLAFEQHIEQLRQLKLVWQRQGVLPMLRQSLHRLGLPSRWLREPGGGERKLTDFLHLAELLQGAATETEGEETLIRWLDAQIAEPSLGGDAHIVRLESDDDLIQIITVFKAKGLEYPVVVLPFASAFRDERKKSDVLPPKTDDPDRERLQEDLRLLYVALTRARHALWVGVPAYKGSKAESCDFHRSALGYLVGATSRVEGAQIGGLLASAAGEGLSIARVGAGALPQSPVTPLAPQAVTPPLGDALLYDARFETDWSIGSFSRLVRDLSKGPVTAAAADPALQEELLVAPVEAAAPPGVRAPRHRFPRGALPGNFLHDQLEWLAASRFALATDADLRERLRRRCERQGWGHRADEVVTWLSEVVTTPLPSLGVALDALEGTLPEMEFWFPSDRLDAGRIDALCHQHLLNHRARPALGGRSLNGLVMGFADLVFEHAGRYWVLDYKSNALGLDDAAYDRDALEGAMAEHRYDVQAALYLLALHRLLRARLGAAYRPSHHLGGAIYLFLRGVHGPERGCYLVAPPTAMLEALDSALGSPSERAA